MRLEGNLKVVGDKSMTHRALLLGAMSKGITTIYHPLVSEDTLSTCTALKQLGIKIECFPEYWKVYGKPIHTWETNQVINVNNSGTTIRLLAGLLASITRRFTLMGDSSLNQRPMQRIINPLSQMGAHFITQNGKAPFTILGGNLKPIEYTLPQASAQVKSAILLAGLNTEGKTIIHEPIPTRNHTETMIPLFGGQLNYQEKSIMIEGIQSLQGTSLIIPGDISSAAFFISAALLVKNSHIQIEQVGINETRMGLVNILKQMGANISFKNIVNTFEPSATIEVKSSPLKGIDISSDQVPSLIDELPLIALIATQAKGTTTISGAEELVFKETNRLVAVYELLKTIGANIELKSDGWIIKGPTPLIGGNINHYGDHRIAMVAQIANLISKEEIIMQDTSVVDVSYPDFFEDLSQLIVKE